MKRLILLLSAASVLVACSHNTPTRQSASAAPSPKQELVEAAPVAAEPAEAPAAQPIDLTHVDAAKLDSAAVVLRVELIEARGGSKYHWDQVRPVEVLKNDSQDSFEAPFAVAHYGWNSGVPRGTSTIYLEPYGEPGQGHWRLLGAAGHLGVSHTQR